MTTDRAPGDVSGMEIGRLVEQLARAESELAAALAARVDSIVDAAGQTYLLREAQQALLRSEALAKERAALLAAILDNAPDYVVCLDRDRRIQFTNGVWKRFRREEVIGADWLSFQFSDQQEPLRSVFESVLSTGQSAAHEGPGHGPEAGTVALYSRHFGPVFEDDQVVGVVIISRDVTSQRAAEAQLIASDRMASVGILAAGVAHEINNPLACVIANLDFAVQDLKTEGAGLHLPSELLEELDDARSGADRVRAIVRDLKLFSRAEDNKREAVDVERVMESTIRMAYNEIRHRARLVKEYGRVPFVTANESRLGQVFLNLVVNAAQAIPEGNAEGNVIRISTSLGSDRRVCIRISDTGPGIPPEIRRRLFTPFFTTKPAGSGTGLGLSICQRIVTSVGGEICFESEVGKGTEFRVVLPMAELCEVPSRPRARSTPSAGRRGRVLVVDDEVTIGVVAKRILTAEHDVVTVTESTRALAMIREGERFDVVLCDLMIPQLTGMDLYDEAVKIDPELGRRFVFMTGGAFTSRAREFLDSSTNQRIEKPFDAQALRALVNGLVR